MTALSEKYEEPGPCGSAAIFFRPPLSSPTQCLTALPSTAPARLLTADPATKKYEELVPRGSAANFFPPPPSSPIQCPAALPSSRLLTADPATQIHPSQGCLAIDDADQACLVTYMYEVAQAMALAAQSSKTPFDPQSLDLPSMGTLVGFYHACLGFPVKQTWLSAIKTGNCDSFDGFTYSNAARYCPDSDKTIMGHLSQQRQNVWSTKPQPPVPEQVPLLPAVAP